LKLFNFNAAVTPEAARLEGIASRVLSVSQTMPIGK
jgi:hypothetical protein